MDIKEELQKIFEFIVKNRGNTITWPNSDIRKFIRWAVHYRKLFTVWVPAGKDGSSQRIAALGIAWRTESVGPQDHELTFENTEFGNNLYIFQTIVHPDFRSSGVLFQLLSVALIRNPGVTRVFWNSQHHQTQKMFSIDLQTLLKRLASQASPKKLRKYIRRKVWEAEEIMAHQFPTLAYLR